MAQEYKPGQIVPQSGVYTITHDPAHADMPHEVIKGRRFPTCRTLQGITWASKSMSAKLLALRGQMAAREPQAVIPASAERAGDARKWPISRSPADPA